jgi:predicted DNA-binding transcriptional regulator YafY
MAGMSRTAERLLSLLSLLQDGRSWTGAELADRLAVTGRTVRNDVDRLRQLGYDVTATRGTVGGYRLGGSGTSLPPLLLDTEEAVAVAVGLRTGVNCIIGGMEETSLRALTKLEQLLPARLRHRVRNLNRYTVPLPSQAPVPAVEPALLSQLVGMCHARERFRFRYVAAAVGELAGDEQSGVRCDVEPHRLVNRGHRWYLLGYDVDEERWDVFEVARIRPRTPSGPRFPERPLPDEDVAGYVAARLPESTWRCRGTAVVHAGATEVEAALLPAEGRVIAGEAGRCRVVLGAESYAAVALMLARTGLPFEVEGPPALVDEVAALGARLREATGRSGGVPALRSGRATGLRAQ